MIAIVDYGVGNLFSLKCSFDSIGEKAIVTNNEKDLIKAERIILPGVGAFEDAAAKLKETGLAPLLKELSKEKPFMGICLGMQLLLEKSYEYGEHEGLGLIKGTVVPILDDISIDLKIPHMGWNALNFTESGRSNPLFKYISEGDFVYFVHSYYCKADSETILAISEYDIPVTAAVSSGNVYGCQFHPEKSGTVGLNILKAFCEL